MVSWALTPSRGAGTALCFGSGLLWKTRRADQSGERLTRDLRVNGVGTSHLWQEFAILLPMTFWAGSFFVVGTALCMTGPFPASLASKQ